MTQQVFHDPNSLNQLTPRESFVLSAAKEHESVAAIANSLDIPAPIVIRHLSNIISKLSESDQKLVHQLVFSYKIDPSHN